ncbi:Uncharacterized protein dnm_069230 [Desulfonema magnum]|uniref:Zinc-finger domain-containing protein n=2 Tax=Desulfonema magnum TaxID=45655 RepID=A0A975BSK3_9BACT|nr:Uncharacterized protein dnm_069230 [Desulfonema magnum]
MMKSACIELETFADYLWGDISEQEIEDMEKHLSECDECRRLFAIANTVLKEEDSFDLEPLSEKKAQSVWQQIKGKIGTLYQWVRELPAQIAEYPWFNVFEPADAFTGVRSKKTPPAEQFIDYIRFVRDINELQAEIYVSKTGDASACMKIRVLKQGQQAKNVRLTLKKDGEKDISFPLRDNAPYVAFEDLIFGRYELLITQYRKEGKQSDSFKFKINGSGISEDE